MYYVYVIQGRDAGDLYFGYTKDLERRLSEHNRQKDWELVYYEAYRAEKDARHREQKLKHYGQSRTHLKNRLESSLLKK